MTKKKCPLFMSAVKGGNWNHNTECIEEKCAWWINTSHIDGCAKKILATVAYWNYGVKE